MFHLTLKNSYYSTSKAKIKNKKDKFLQFTNVAIERVHAVNYKDLFDK